MKRRIIAVALIGAMLAALVGGCGTKGSGDTEKSANETSVEPWEEDGVTVTWWLMGGPDTYYQTYWSEMKGLQKLQEAVNISIEFQVATSYDAYLPMMAAGNYPDVITAKNLEQYPGGLSGMYTEGVSQDLTPYMEEGLMPNFKAILEEYPDLARDLRLDTGEYTFLSGMYDRNDEEDRVVASEYGLAMRGDWLENVGLDVPTNMDEWYTVLTAFKTQDPNGNGERDEVPICLASSCWKYFLPAYGIDDDPSIQKDENGEEKIIYGYMSDAYKEYLTEFNKWYTDGLFENMFEQTSLEKREEAVINNLAGAWKGEASHFDIDAEDSYLSKVQEKAPDAYFVAAPWPETADGYHWCFSDIASFNRDTTVITKNAVNDGVDSAAAYLLDYMLSEEGGSLIVWGIEGESYTVNDDGTKQLVDGMEEHITFEGADIQKINTYVDPLTVVFPGFGQASDYVLTQKSEAYVGACRVWAEGDTSYKIQPSCQLTAEKQTEIDDLENNMKNYITKMRAQFITGKTPMTNYDTYLSNVERLGGETYVEIWQEAYDNYMNR